MLLIPSGVGKGHFPRCARAKTAELGHLGSSSSAKMSSNTCNLPNSKTGRGSTSLALPATAETAMPTASGMLGSWGSRVLSSVAPLHHL